MSNSTKVLGEKVTEAIDHIESVVLVGESRYSEIKFSVHEFTSVCPVTGQPDYYDIDIVFKPNGYSIESKRLKLWLWGYRNKGIFCEMRSDEIASHIQQHINPLELLVTVKQTPRGGIGIESKSFITNET